MHLSTTILLLMSLLSLFGCGHNGPAPAPGTPLKSLRYSGTHGYHAYSNIGFRAQRQDDGTTRIALEVGNDRDRVFFYGPEVMDHLDSLVAAYKMYKFNGHYEPKFEVLDGDSWSLELDFADGTWTSCGGYMAYPPGKGGEAIGRLEGLLNGWLDRGPAEGTVLTGFRYEIHTGDEDSAYGLTRTSGDSPLAISWLKRGMAREETLSGADSLLAQRLCDMMRWGHVYTYTGEDPAAEDASRPRWKLSVTFSDGWSFSTMDYLDREPEGESWRQGVPSFTEMDLMHETSSLFSEEIARLGAAVNNR